MQYPSTPQLRLSTVNLLTDLGWCAGTLHVPGRQSLVDFLAPGTNTVKVTQVRIPSESERLPFIGFRRDAIILHGTVEVLVNVRVSDFFRQQPGMAVLRDCALVPYGQPSDSNQARRMRSALVNLSRVAGVAEWVNQQV